VLLVEETGLAFQLYREGQCYW